MIGRSHVARRAAVAVALIALAACAGSRTVRAQHVRRTDDITQTALVLRGLSAETTCGGERHRSSGGGLTPLPDLDEPLPPFSLAASLAGMARRTDVGTGPSWRGSGAGQIRAHGRHTGCHFDWRARALVATSRAGGGDAAATLSAPGALGGAVHLYGEASAGNARANAELDVPQQLAAGLAYTSFNLYRALLPTLYDRAAFDVRVRLSAGASFAYRSLRQQRGQSAVPELSAIVVGKIEEVLHGGVFYSAHVIPNELPGERLVEHTVSLLHVFRAGGGPSTELLMRSPYVTARYATRRVGSFAIDRELALSAGLTLF